MIPLYLIETFVVFGENLNLVKTAQVLEQTQPTTSRQIELLQSYFKKPLFKTVGRNKLLTDYGQQVQQYFKKSVLELRELQNKMASVSFGQEKEKLSLAARSEILEKYISVLQVDSTVEMVALTGQEIRSRMHAQSLDIAVLQENFESLYYFRKKLFSSEWKIIFPESWKKTFSQKSPDAEQILMQALLLPFASYDKDLQTVKGHLTKRGQIESLNMTLIVADWRLILHAVKQQRHWAIVPEDFSKAEGVVSISASTILTSSTFYLYVLKSLGRNKAVAQMVLSLKSQA